ncbi:MAG: hypothetical protein AB7V08_07195 [Elusimicrobiales bacterium]
MNRLAVQLQLRFEPIGSLPGKSCEFVFNFLFLIDQLGFTLSVLGLSKMALQYQIQQLAQLVSKDNQLTSQLLPGTLPGLGQCGSFLLCYQDEPIGQGRG